VVERVRAPLAGLVDELRAERDQLALQLAESVSERNKLVARHAKLTNQHDELVSRYADLVCQLDRQTAEHDKLADQLGELASREGPELVLETANVTSTRVATILTNLQTDRARRLRSLFSNDGYLSPSVTIRRLSNSILDTSTGLVVLQDGRLEEFACNVASYYIDTTRDGLSESVRKSLTDVVTSDVIHVFHRSCGAYGHFVLDGLCALALLIDTIRDRNLKILIPNFLPKWATDALAGIGFHEECLVRVAGTVICEKMLLPSTLSSSNSFFPRRELIYNLKKLTGISNTVAASRRIYLTREDAHSPRFVKNDAAVEAAFLAAGFDIVRPAKMGFREQIELFASAAVIAGNHGSAFTNMVFANPGAQIIDLMPEHWVGYWGEAGKPERWLFNLSAACDHNYSVILSSSSMEGEPYLQNSPQELPKIETEVDIDLLRVVLSRLPV
jgi:hypothetical protein